LGPPAQRALNFLTAFIIILRDSLLQASGLFEVRFQAALKSYQARGRVELVNSETTALAGYDMQKRSDRDKAREQLLAIIDKNQSVVTEVA